MEDADNELKVIASLLASFPGGMIGAETSLELLMVALWQEDSMTEERTPAADHRGPRLRVDHRSSHANSVDSELIME